MNFDLMAERYFSNVGILSAGVFYKNISDFIYEQETKKSRLNLDGESVELDHLQAQMAIVQLL